MGLSEAFFYGIVVSTARAAVVRKLEFGSSLQDKIIPQGSAPKLQKDAQKKKKKRDPKRLPPEQTLNLTKSLRQR